MAKRGVTQKKSLKHRLRGFLSFSQFISVLRRKKVKDDFTFKLPKKIRQSKGFIPLAELKEEMEHKLSKKKTNPKNKLVKRKAVKKKVAKKKAVKRKAVKHKVVKKKAVKRKVVKKKVVKRKQIKKKQVKKKVISKKRKR